MTRRAKPAKLKPRLLTAEQAAAYLGGLPVAAFRRLRLGEVSLGPRVFYDRHALDAHLDRASGLAALSPAIGPAAANDDPEAAFARSAPDLSDASRRP